MSDLVAFLEARLAEDQRMAEAATAGPWRIDSPIYAETITSADGTQVVAGGRWGGEASVFDTTEDAVHIARHDPARVLREVAAKQRIVAEHVKARGWDGTGFDRPVCGTCAENEDGGGLDGDPYPCHTLRLLANVWSDHPDYLPEWAPDVERLESYTDWTDPGRRA